MCSYYNVTTRRNEFKISQIKAGRNYGVNEWKEDVKKLVHRSGIQQEKIVFLCNAADFQKRVFFDYVGRLIAGFEISELFTVEERMEMVELYQKRTKEAVSELIPPFRNPFA